MIEGYHWGWLNGQDASGGAGWIECKSLDILDRGDHRVVLAEVVDADAGTGKLLPLEGLGWHYGG